MAQYKGTVHTHHEPMAVWEYLSDLRSVGEWDPSVESVRLVSGTPGTVGARYELEVDFLGRSITLPYETVEVNPPYNVVFAAETSSAAVRDEARIAGEPGGRTTVTWDADLRLKGPGRLLDLPLRAAFGRIGSRAEDGLDQRLGEAELTPVGRDQRVAA